MTLAEEFGLMRRAAVPLIAVATADPSATAESLAAPRGSGNQPTIIWDCVRGARAGNEAGVDGAQKIGDKIDPVEALVTALNLDPPTVLIMAGMGMILGQGSGSDAAICQAILNLRNAFKATGRTLVLLTDGAPLPGVLQQDVLSIDVPLPTRDELALILDAETEAASQSGLTIDPIKGSDRDAAVSGLQGLAAFPAEQAVALSIIREGRIVPTLLAERKRAYVNQTPGLTWERPTESMEDSGGLVAIKTYSRRRFEGSEPPSVVCRIEEIEKATAGAGGPGGLSDSSGTSQDARAVFLNAMEDFGWTGILALGPPGSGKSMYSKALGASYGAATLTLDFGAMKGSYVGQSERMVRSAIKTLHAIGNSRVFMVATCNSLSAVPPEVQRRFKDGKWFFDLPDAEEREAILVTHMRRYGIKDRGTEFVNMDGWTGAEIRNVCELASKMRMTLAEAAQYIVPVSVSDPESLERLRTMAHGRFLSASRPGLYRRPSGLTETEKTGRSYTAK